MQRLLTYLVITCLCCSSIASRQKSSAVFVDKKGIMRYSDTKEEASFFGVNYTLPFAHAYRAMEYLGKDRKEAIDKDVYHFARLSFNAYRIHIWDVEISDGDGRLIENEHLDLLDYLIYKLKERNIKIVLTTMTNFGNGYPEKNQATGGFSYNYDKCDIHDNPEAIKAQENYISALVQHVNPYTKTAYLNDSDIVGFEINNEPCHAGTLQQTQSYIDRMIKAIKKTGSMKPIFYNVSHNMQQIDAYYNSDIQGTTYQWYPIGLVAGHTRKGNFLPYVENYAIPFKGVKGFDTKAKLVYEYDPADITYSYMHPAMVRTFRSAGFQWITQFAYDPMDMAQYNTEYQTHYLNLAYTPQKTISMKIAAEVSRNIPLFTQYEKYPNDTVFGDFRVSYLQDLSEMNRADKFYYSNQTTTLPVQPEKLESVAGYGNSPVVSYEGTGAYFIDKLEDGLWRLEIMPDVVAIHDPFTKPSLKREVSVIIHNKWDMAIRLPDLQDNFSVVSLGNTKSFSSIAKKGTINAISPGVYLLKKKDKNPDKTWDANTQWENITLGEYVAPETSVRQYSVYHLPPMVVENNAPLVLEAQIAGPEFPDSVIIYTNKISFWREKNPYYKMDRIHGYTYRATIPTEELNGNDFGYVIVICNNGKYYIFPDGTEINPQDWDYSAEFYKIEKAVKPDSPVELFSVSDEWSGLESYLMPEGWRIERKVMQENPAERPTLRFIFTAQEESSRLYLQKYIRNLVENRHNGLQQFKNVCIQIKECSNELQIGFINRNGFTYTASIQPTVNKIIRIPVSDLVQTKTVFLPHSYPVFLDKYFTPDVDIPFSIRDIEKLEISVGGEKGKQQILEIGSVWLE